MNSYVKLGIAALLPVAAAVILDLLDRKTKYGSLSYNVKQIITGILFGGLAIVGTEWGIPLHGAQVNCRDASVLTAGLLFGVPAGILAGIIGGVERWVAVAWGVGTFTRVACSVSTIIAGFYAAALRRFMFEKKRPRPFITFGIGVVMEIFHLTMVFVTNMKTPDAALNVIKACTIPMVTANAVSAGLAAFFTELRSGNIKREERKETASVLQAVQRWLLVCVMLAFLMTTAFIYRLQTSIAENHLNTLMNQALNETWDDIRSERGDISRIADITENRHIGETGYVLIYNRDKFLISSPQSMHGVNVGYQYTGIGTARPDERYMTTVNGERCFCLYRNNGDYTMLAVFPQQEALKTRDIAIYVNSFMEILIFAVVFALIYLLIDRVVVSQISKVNKSLSRITEGDLDEVVNVRSSAEFASLSDGINATVDTLKEYIDEASKRIDKELGVAKDIQASALPGIFPAFPQRKDFDIYAFTHPAKEVGGDFYDFYMTGDNTLNFLIADVSGKGIPAAMFMMRAKTQLKGLTESGMPLEEVFTVGNSDLCEGNDAGMFVTAWQASVNLDTGLLRFANAGHNPPLVCHEGGKFEYVKGRAGFVLAGMEGVRYRSQQMNLTKGDIVLLYTDGVTEATDINNELYGEDRLLECVNSKSFEKVEMLCKYVKQDVDRFVGEAPQFDDITMVAFKYMGTGEKFTKSYEKACLENIPEVIEYVEDVLSDMGASMKVVTQFDVAMDEVLANIISYAYNGDPGPMKVEVYSENGGKTACVRFTDSGIPYNPLTHKDPDITLPAEEREIGGLGIFMVKKTMDSVVYSYEDDKNILTIKKDI